ATFSAVWAIMSNITDLPWANKRYRTSHPGGRFGADQLLGTLSVLRLAAGAAQDEGNVLLIVDDALGGDPTLLVNQEGKRRGVNLVLPRDAELLLHQHWKTRVDLAGPAADRLRGAVVDHQHLRLAAVLQVIEPRHDRLAGVAAGLREDEQHLAAGIVLQGRLGTGGAGQGELWSFLAHAQAIAAESPRRGRVQLL